MRGTLVKVGVAIGAGALPLVLGQGTALAGTPPNASAGKDVEFTFTRGGQQLTCTVRGGSQYSYFPELDYTVLRGDTSIDPNDAGCADAVSLLMVTASWAAEPGDEWRQVAVGRSEGGTVATVPANDQGGIASLVVEHEVAFVCDAGPGLCRTTFTTTPK
jgi:hypothetical protein